MGECVNEIDIKAEAFETIEKRALDLICKRGYDREALIKELQLDPSDLKIRIRKELNEYRKLK